MDKIQMTKQWAVSEDNQWRPIEAEVKPKLEPGIYEVINISGGLFSSGYTTLKKMDIKSDKLLSLPGSLAEYIMKSIETFWNTKDKYSSMGLLHKRGIMMEGAPGTGKTAICLLTGLEFGKRGGVALFVSPNSPVSPLPQVFKTIRDFHPDLPILNILEDINRHSKEIDTLLPLLDGENQIGNIVHLATTNFIDKLDARLTNRPSRFDEVIKADAPIGQTRQAYFQTILPKDSHKMIDKLVENSNGLGFAHMKELAISVHVFGKDIVKTSNRLRGLAENKGTGFVTTKTEEVKEKDCDGACDCPDCKQAEE